MISAGRSRDEAEMEEEEEHRKSREEREAPERFELVWSENVDDYVDSQTLHSICENIFNILTSQQVSVAI